MQYLDRFGHLLAFLAVALVAVLAWKLGAPGEITGPLGLVLTGLVVQAARNSDPPSGPPPPAAVALIAPFCWLAGILALVALLPGCGGVSLPPGAMQLIDVVARSAETVAHFADAAQKLAPVVADVPERIARGRTELKAGGYIDAAGTFFGLAQDFRSAGVPMPDEVQAATDYLGQLAATAVEQGMRALSGRKADGSPKP